VLPPPHVFSFPSPSRNLCPPLARLPARTQKARGVRSSISTVNESHLPPSGHFDSDIQESRTPVTLSTRSSDLPTAHFFFSKQVPPQYPCRHRNPAAVVPLFLRPLCPTSLCCYKINLLRLCFRFLRCHGPTSHSWERVSDLPTRDIFVPLVFHPPSQRNLMWAPPFRPSIVRW